MTAPEESLEFYPRTPTDPCHALPSYTIEMLSYGMFAVIDCNIQLLTLVCVAAGDWCIATELFLMLIMLSQCRDKDEE